ncbi:4-hydroxy-tetrahydrodipicolinate reductase [Pleomorphomonas carboxyditropha]|uniref:4-hydroxy-tetrahydrodipicolinate reductase n=1 Tax=Pleomorphomonas carboxyditropha TaxID=2023338 RepID=A0A2G9WPH7_9HYPH|nr:4-hydroxy-tetrahydrodipicolinate reductase [Pleomorphomonas carboxyditropha]PIO96555.1 4-hydroxy-tetrahydrodipicolinate reductase [Pleomorphomonas carboxyditropha]
MTIRVIVAGATGWTGSAVAKGVRAAEDLTLAGAVARSAAGRDIGEVLGEAAAGITVVATVAEALKAGADVLVDYTAPQAVKANTLQAVSAGVAVVIGTSGLSVDDYAEIDAAARANDVGVFAAGNYSITATLMTKFALTAAKYVADVEVIDYASAGKADTPSGTARELAERLSDLRQPATSKPVSELAGIRETRGGAVGAVQVHSLRLPGYVLSCEAQFGAPGERLLIRHDAGSDATPYVAGTLLAVRRVREQAGLRRGLDLLIE